MGGCLCVFVSRCAVRRREHEHEREREPYLLLRYPCFSMSFADAESLKPILLRSSTPGLSCFPRHPYPTTHLSFLSAERERYILHLSPTIHFLTLFQVLLYLEGLRESQTIDSPNSSGFPNLPLPSSKLSALDNDQDFDDINSNVQDGRKTELSIGRQSALVGIPFSSLPSSRSVQPRSIARTWSTRSARPSLRVI